MPNDSQILVLGSRALVSGAVIKVVRRTDALRLVVEENGFRAYANFKDDVFKANKIRKGSHVKLCGIVTSLGTSAVCLSGCKIVEKAVT
jgi:hypothetical protein